ncbi:hypothetical protein R1flu_026274 [Riccia fluitans]|uniref:Peroxidase n=1 Tax=Riccia fluitans TaxID=41844 RepID=A0ABD1XFH1_9MARC
MTSLVYTFTSLILIMFVSSFRVIADTGGAGLQDNYYKSSCPPAEAVVKRVAVANFTDPSDPRGLRFAAGLLRLSFHDCHVDGCDASVLLDGPNAEKTAEVNTFLTGFEIIDKAKAELESVCPGVVSCADIIAYAARDAVIALNGTSFNVQGGRKDGIVSLASRAQAQLPSPDMTVTELTANFARKGLSMDQMVILSGSHTSAASHCPSIVRRLYNFNGTGQTDPSMPSALADRLKALCPKNTFNDTVIIPLDSLSFSFDTGYYRTLQIHEGVFTSDQSLYDDQRTQPLVNLLTNNALFQAQFGQAMRAMGRVGVKLTGEIRRDCRKVN